MGTDRFRGKKVVMTGASSGLGRAASLMFAEEGADVALIARSEKPMQILKNEIEMKGSQALCLPIDVCKEQSVKDAADKVASSWGGIDIWVNNAAVSLYGEADHLPVKDIKRVMDVNFLGQVHGFQAALPYLEAADGAGRLICVLSALSRSSVPLQSAYVASKHALYGFFSSVQEELRYRKAKTKISMILASSMNTPLSEHAKTYLGVQPRLVPPIYPVERSALVILDEAETPHDERMVGLIGSLLALGFGVAPRVSRRLQGLMAYEAQFSNQVKSPSESNNLYAPQEETDRVYGPDETLIWLNELETRLDRILRSTDTVFDQVKKTTKTLRDFSNQVSDYRKNKKAA
jgi:short-subunit dehydrogenase